MLDHLERWIKEQNSDPVILQGHMDIVAVKKESDCDRYGKS